MLRTASVVVPATIDVQDHVGCATLVVTSNLSYQINVVKKKLQCLPATEVVFLNLHLQKCFVSKPKFTLTCCLSDCVNINWLRREGKPYKQRSLQHMARQRNQVFDVTN